jgi:hypothetical protein
VKAALPSRARLAPENFFDSEHAALRATILSVARDGHRLLCQRAQNHTRPDSRSARSLIGRIDELDLELAHRGHVPVQRWAYQLKCRLMDRVASEA